MRQAKTAQLGVRVRVRVNCPAVVVRDRLVVLKRARLVLNFDGRDL